MMSSDRAHAALDSHASGQYNTSDHHDAPQPFPSPPNFELIEELKGEGKGPSASLLLDGRLQPTDIREPQEHARKFAQGVPALASKHRAPPPPPLKLATSNCSHTRSEWHIASPRSPGLSDSNSATHIQSDHSGVGAGYFSPPQSPNTSASTPVPSSLSTSISLIQKARSRARSVGNVDLPKLSASKIRGARKMVKERRSLQSLLMPSFLQPQPTPLGLVSGPRAETRSAPTQGATSSANGPSMMSGADGNGTERRRSFYSRRRSHTYSGRDTTLTSPSLASIPTRIPPMPEGCPPQTSGLAPAGRESPSSYLLDDDPFAVSSPALVVPPANSPTQSPGYTPIPSPACSITHSRSPSTVSLSSASSTSMPGTPVFQSFGPLPEEREEEGLSRSLIVSPPPLAVPSAPPPTPASPLNPNATSIFTVTERAESQERMLRLLSATPSSTPVPTLAHPATSSSSPISPSKASSHVSSPPPSRVRPAHTRPAFSSRPSLPSLSTLSRMSTAAGELASSLRGKKRRGKVGAGLPAEPWDLPTPEPAPERHMTDMQEEDGVEEGSLEWMDIGREENQDAEDEKDEKKECVGPAANPVSDNLVPEKSLEDPDSDPTGQSDTEKPFHLASTFVEDAGTPRVLPSAIVQRTDDHETSRITHLDLDKPGAEESESILEGDAGSEDVNGKVEGVAGNAHGEGGISIDAGLTYMTGPSSISEVIEDTNGESADTTAMIATLSDIAPLSKTRAERDVDEEADQLIEDSSLNPGNDSRGGEGLDHLAAPELEPSSSQAKVGSRAITIPGRASAIPRHVLRALSPYPFAAPRSASPASSNASWSPQSSIEDFGVLLSSSPHFLGDQRPESLAIDPGLPDKSARTQAYVHEQAFRSGRDQLNLKDHTSSPSSPSVPLPSLIPREGGDPEIETTAGTTVVDIDLGSASDATFTSEAEAPADSHPAPNYATLPNLSLPSRESLRSSPITASVEPVELERAPSSFPIREDEPSIDSASSSEDCSLSPQHEEDYAAFFFDDHDYGVEPDRRRPPLEEDDGSMLPPLSTLPEEDPVFTLTPAHSRERSEYVSLSSRSVSRKASVATIASIFSMRSGSSGCASQNSLTYSRGHSPAASLSTTLPISTSQTDSGIGSFIGRRGHGSNTGSADSGRGHAPYSSVSSPRSKSFLDLRGQANIHRHGSQSSGTSMLTHSSTRTKFDPQSEVPGHRKSSVEEVAFGLRAYTGNPYAVAVQAELEGKASKYEVSSGARYGDDELVIDIKHGDVALAAGDAVPSDWKPYDSKMTGLDMFEPGSSAGTLRPSMEQLETERIGTRSASESNEQSELQYNIGTMLARGHTNGYGYSGSRGGAGKDWGDAGGHGHGYGNGYYGRRNGSSGSEYNGGKGGASGAGRRGRGNSRDDDEQRSSRRPSAYSPTSSESESESESDTDNYGEESSGVAQSPNTQAPTAHAAPSIASARDEAPIFSQLRNGRKGVFKPSTTSSASNATGGHTPATEDDDVPLAQRIPGALQAQKSIRQQVRSERDRRRRERPMPPAPRTSRAPEGTISPPPQHVPGIHQDERGRTLTVRVPKSAPLGGGAAPLSSSQEAAMMAQQIMQPRHATHAVRRPRAQTLSGAEGPGVPPDVLMKRLLKVQARDQDPQMPMQRMSAASTVPAQTSAHAYERSPIERASGMQTMSRLGATSPQHSPQHMQQDSASADPPTRTLRPMRSFHGVPREPASTAPVPVPPVPAPSARRRSPSRARQAPDMNGASDVLARNRSVKGTRTSDKAPRKSEEEANVLHSHYPPVPPIPSVSRGPSPPAPISRHNLVQTRIYINDMQRFNVVGAGLDTNAKDVLDMLRQQGDLRGEERRSSSWMLYEVCHDFGMERPVRSFELVTDISGSWNKEKTMNCFMVKPSPFAHSLANIPSSIPTRSGFVDYESKKGKWSKRWLELREHGLWISKREGKDNEFLCSLSAFDAYIVTRIHKATKSFTFAVKSTDPITLFENKADYLHVFSVPEDTGLAWLDAIWLARSYILHQERNVLFRNKSAGDGSNMNTGASLARSGTRKKPAQTYISLAQPKAPGAAEAVGPFEPGSLLAKRAVS